MFSTQPRRTLLPGALSALSLLALSLGCGGGTEPVAPVPVIEGTGSASAQLDGVDLGATPLVETIIRDQVLVPTDFTERVTFTVVVPGEAPVAFLSNGDLAFTAITAVDVADGSNYTEGTDFDVERTGGVLTATFFGGIVDGTEADVTYRYSEPLFTISVGVAIATGDRFLLTVYNLPLAPIVSPLPPINLTSGVVTPNGELGFYLEGETGLTLSISSGVFELNTNCDGPADPCPQQNTLNILSVNLDNRLDPCFEGNFAVTLEDRLGVDHVLVADFSDPISCP